MILTVERILYLIYSSYRSWYLPRLSLAVWMLTTMSGERKDSPGCSSSCSRLTLLSRYFFAFCISRQKKSLRKFGFRLNSLLIFFFERILHNQLSVKKLLQTCRNPKYVCFWLRAFQGPWPFLFWLPFESDRLNMAKCNFDFNENGWWIFSAVKTLRGFEASPIRGLMVVDGWWRLGGGGGGGDVWISAFCPGCLTPSPEHCLERQDGVVSCPAQYRGGL